MKVDYPLASLPESFNVLVTALEANPEVPKMAVIATTRGKETEGPV